MSMLFKHELNYTVYMFTKCTNKQTTAETERSCTIVIPTIRYAGSTALFNCLSFTSPSLFSFKEFTTRMKLFSLTAALAVAFPSFTLATSLLWPVPQSMESGYVELELDVCKHAGNSCHFVFNTYTGAFQLDIISHLWARC